MIWLTGQLAPDFKTIADFRKDNGKAIREVCREFVALSRKLGLLVAASVAIDGSKFKAVNARDKNFTEAKVKRRLEQIDESVARYLSQLETADRHGDAVPEAKVARLKDKIEKLKEETVRLNAIKAEMMKSEDKQISLTDPDARSRQVARTPESLAITCRLQLIRSMARAGRRMRRPVSTAAISAYVAHRDKSTKSR